MKRKGNLWPVLFSGILAFCFLAALGCNNVAGSSTTYSVTYDGNGNSGGSVPVDSTVYTSGQTVTVLGDTGSLVKTGTTFSGWNTAADGSGTSYVAGATFAIGTANVTLYAVWPTIYALGGVKATANDTWVPGYWSNGVWTQLSTPSGATSFSQNSDFFVSGGAIYTRGSATTAAGATVYGYWKNGDWTALTPTAGFSVESAWSMATSNGDVYILGNQSKAARATWINGYWVNNVWHELVMSTSAYWNKSMNNIAVANGNVYINGSVNDGTNVVTPGYWIGNAWNPLTLPTGCTFNPDNQVNEFRNLVISGSTVYNTTSVTDSNGSIIHGYYANDSWTPFALPAGTTGVSTGYGKAIASGNSLYVKGSVTTASGTENGYWANGVWTVPTATVAGTTVNSVNRLFVSDSTLYVGGSLQNGIDYLPGYWKNDSWTSLSPDTSFTGGSVDDITVYGNTVYAGGGSTKGFSATSYVPSCPGYWANGTWNALALPQGYSVGWVSQIFVQ
jgi:predicted outer membrane repeat protein